MIMFLCRKFEMLRRSDHYFIQDMYILALGKYSYFVLS